MGFYPATHAVFGAMADKDLRPMFERVGPLIDCWYFTDLPLPRAAQARDLEGAWRSVNTRKDVQSSLHAHPRAALLAAIEAAKPTDSIVVFGSFHTVGGVLEDGLPRLQARHLSS